MKSLGSVGSFLWALMLFVAIVCTGNCFKQELWLYDAQGNGLYFNSPISDTSNTLLLPQVTTACARGKWHLFSNANFQTSHAWFGSPSNTSIVCDNFTTGARVKSLRHLGASDTDTDALSLYDGKDFNGTEIFVATQAQTGIKNQIITIAGTGTSDWMLFEGQELDGKSTCFEVPRSDSYLNANYVSNLGLITVGSVFKGCDAQEIQNYKMLYKCPFVNSN